MNYCSLVDKYITVKAFTISFAIDNAMQRLLTLYIQLYWLTTILSFL